MCIAPECSRGLFLQYKSINVDFDTRNICFSRPKTTLIARKKKW